MLGSERCDGDVVSGVVEVVVMLATSGVVMSVLLVVVVGSSSSQAQELAAAPGVLGRNSVYLSWFTSGSSSSAHCSGPSSAAVGAEVSVEAFHVSKSKSSSSSLAQSNWLLVQLTAEALKVAMSDSE